MVTMVHRGGGGGAVSDAMCHRSDFGVGMGSVVGNFGISLVVQDRVTVRSPWAAACGGPWLGCKAASRADPLPGLHLLGPSW